MKLLFDQTYLQLWSHGWWICFRRVPMSESSDVGQKKNGMTTINWRRVMVSGIVTGLVWGLLYAVVHEVVEAHDRSGRPVLPLTPFQGAGVAIRAIVLVNPIVLGILTMWLYAGIRPRFGPGPRTAALAGFAVWFLSSWVQVSWAAFTAVQPRLLIGPLGSSLPIALAAAITGGWLYKE